MMQKIGYITDRILYLSPHTETDRPILAAIRGKHRTLMIDTGNSPAHADLFINKLRQQSHPLPHMAVLTHWHWDHTFGCHQIDVPILAHEETKRSMEKIIPLSWTDEALVPE
ncbi:MBL fold metallo-hydrolase [Kroppenstedtia pulmonis]|uniref:MBL fold metallo-hydrolase n=1 Tax=Kroppenstedtia pulmonis TaxID=1380685 RepID=A0A7D4BI19_9BACL|nr:MBL fold metallo-hydrolase [Kroppenstedtia pulmonis]QKG85015.1 MBL fold metallo-hydrolase [Kroppenstedtia pulmonis]